MKLFADKYTSRVDICIYHALGLFKIRVYKSGAKTTISKKPQIKHYNDIKEVNTNSKHLPNILFFVYSVALTRVV